MKTACREHAGDKQGVGASCEPQKSNCSTSNNREPAARAQAAQGPQRGRRELCLQPRVAPPSCPTATAQLPHLCSVFGTSPLQEAAGAGLTQVRASVSDGRRGGIGMGALGVRRPRSPALSQQGASHGAQHAVPTS